jgi:hypothetical protein
MNTKHTPGPWRENSQGDSEYIFSEVYGAIAIIPHGGIHRDEHKANAQLIAAAPDLLDALQTIVSVLSDWDNATNQGKYANLIEYANKAINKATNQ